MRFKTYQGTVDDIANVKFGHMNDDEHVGLGLVLREFPPRFKGIKPWCGQLHGILFSIWNEKLFIGTPTDPALLYGPILAAWKQVVVEIETSF